MYPGRAKAAHDTFQALWDRLLSAAASQDAGPRPPLNMNKISRKLHHCVLTRETLTQLMDLDQPRPIGRLAESHNIPLHDDAGASLTRFHEQYELLLRSADVGHHWL
ncbi:hypothetical protein SAMN04487914_13929 [Arthrobacter sp. ok909]|nr:hypothetical protein SAMN04487914_13929 [Arthrobacter sp. ok909]